jgi:hypothetical protein
MGGRLVGGTPDLVRFCLGPGSYTLTFGAQLLEVEAVALMGGDRDG